MKRTGSSLEPDDEQDTDHDDESEPADGEVCQSLRVIPVSVSSFLKGHSAWSTSATYVTTGRILKS